MNKFEGSADEEFPPQANISTAVVAISGSKKTKYVVKWALDKFVPEGRVHFILLHVRPLVSRIPTPMGNFIPISQVREDVAAAFRKEVEWQVTEKLLPYKQMCLQRKVQVEVVQIECDDIVSAISSHVDKHKIMRLVVGSSSKRIFSRARTLSSKISESCPNFCSVYAVSKGKAASLRPSNSDEKAMSFRDDISEESSSSMTNASYTNTYSSSDTTEKGSMGSFSNFRSASLPDQRFRALSNINQTLLHARNASVASERYEEGEVYVEEEKIRIGPSTSSSFSSSVLGDNPPLDRPSTSNLSSQDQAINEENVDMDLEKLRIELRHIRGMYAMAQGEAIDASRKLDELEKHHLEEKMKLKQASLREEEAKEMARRGKERYEAVKRESKFLTEAAEREISERRDAEDRARRKAKERENLENALDGSFLHYREFAWDEIVIATSSFSDDLKIGMGAYGTVYKCSFNHTTAAVKVLRSKELSRNKQFRQELDILSKIRHPHLLILLGACTERSCLVYEFMENGSLEDKLLRKSIDASPLRWFDRFRIAWEVASALAFLHDAKPNSIVHRDLKPANILLDKNLVSKIGDVGLSTVLDGDYSVAPSSNYKETAPIGTLCYIDPEYQRTGVITAKSDVYAFGIIVLQLLTARPAVALAHLVETAVEENRLGELLDRTAGPWPVQETNDLALMALRCTELRRRDRPDLRDEVLPFLERMKGVAEKAQGLAFLPGLRPPSHFVCPILKEVMSDPCWRWLYVRQKSDRRMARRERLFPSYYVAFPAQIHHSQFHPSFCNHGVEIWEPLTKFFLSRFMHLICLGSIFGAFLMCSM